MLPHVRLTLLYRVRHKSVNTPLSHERLVVRTWHWVLTDLCLTRGVN
jgi:hypothetical protein